MPFQSVTKSTTFNGCTTLYCRNDVSFGAQCGQLSNQFSMPLVAGSSEPLKIRRSCKNLQQYYMTPQITVGAIPVDSHVSVAMYFC